MKGKLELAKAIRNLKLSSTSNQSSVAMYTCKKVVMLVGVIGGQLLVIDTHSRIESISGNKTACLVIFKKHPNEVEHLCSWLLGGLKSKGAMCDCDCGQCNCEMQSFSMMRLELV